MTDQLKPVREGSRWRHARPDEKEVAEWFGTVRMAEGLLPENYISGVVLIPATEKVKKATEGGTTEVWELTFTPYMRVDTRIAYAYDLAETSGLIFAKEAVGVADNDLPPGFWWLGIPRQDNPAQGQRYLCCTMRVAFYREDDWFNAPTANDGSVRTADIRPVRWGVATKQVSPHGYQGKIDDNVVAKAETGAVGRALGMAGVLVVGTGVATAEDMAELRDAPAPAEAALPSSAAVDTEASVNERLIALQAALRPHAEAWQAFAAWWTERSAEGGWKAISDAPIEVRRGVVSKMEKMIADILDAEPVAT